MALIDRYNRQHVEPVLNDVLDAMSELQLELAVSRFANAKVKAEDGQFKPVNEGFSEFLESGGMEKVLQENPMLLQQLIHAKQGRQYRLFPEVLKSAFNIYRGINAPELVKKTAEKTAKQVKQQITKNNKAVMEKPTSGKPGGKKDSLAELEAKLANVSLNMDF